MNNANVYFSPIQDNAVETIATQAKDLLVHFLTTESVLLTQKLPIKVHSGEPGNDTFIKPAYFDAVIDYLESKHIAPYFIETNTSYGGPRATTASHLTVAKNHGFTRIPFVIGDVDGFGHTEVSVPGKHFKTAKIASKLADQEQVLVMTHFKGHVMAGFGGAIKMLGIGFASARGKSELHGAQQIPDGKQLDWSHWQKEDGSFNPDVVHSGQTFYERLTEYAYAASHGKRHIYMTFAMNITADCDCDGKHMEPVYPNLGIFISSDPVAIDTAVVDMLAKREGKTPFEGTSVLDYAEQLGMGTKKYVLKTLK